jgi:hypothetical protein
MEICDKVLMDFLAATDVGKFLPQWGMLHGGQWGLLSAFLSVCHEILIEVVNPLYFSFISGDQG